MTRKQLIKTASASLRYQRTIRGLSQEDLASRLKVSKAGPFLAGEQGHALPTIENAVNMAQIYGVSLTEILGLEMGA